MCFIKRLKARNQKAKAPCSTYAPFSQLHGYSYATPQFVLHSINFFLIFILSSHLFTIFLADEKAGCSKCWL